VLVLAAVACASAVGIALAFLTTRTNIPFSRSIGVVAFAPLLVPPFMLVVGWLMLAAPRIGLFNVALHQLGAPFSVNIYTRIGVIWVTTLYLVPYIYVIAAAGFKSGSSVQEEAARICGAGPRRVFWRITVRLNLPSILAGMMLALVLAAENFIIPTVLGGQAHFEVLSTAIWQNMNGYPAQAGLAAAEGFILTVFGLILLVGQRRTLARGSHATLSEKGIQSAAWDLGRWRYAALLPIALYALLAVVLPVAAIVVVSLLRYWTTDITAANATMSNYSYIFTQYPLLRSGLKNTLELAIGGATITVAVSLLLAWKASRTTGALRQLISYISIVPIGIPGIAFGLAILLSATDVTPALYGTFWILLISYIVGYLPMAMQPVSAGIQQMGHDLEDSARLSGASWLRTLRSITFPLVRPSLAAGWILLYVLLLRDVSRTVLLYTPKTVTMSIGLLDLQTEGYYPRLAAYSVLFLALGIVPLVVVQRFLASDRHRRR
jgi:iron(III) transport system permease protein